LSLIFYNFLFYIYISLFLSFSISLSLSLSLPLCLSLSLSLSLPPSPSRPLSRQAASLLFSTPPTATHEQALAHLKRAEALAPGQWKENALLIARACGKTHRRAQQQQWVRRALAVPSRTAEDRRAHREAETLLRSLGGEAPAGSEEQGGARSEEQAVRSGEGEEQAVRSGEGEE
jgi:hypothetical protein